MKEKDWESEFEEMRKTFHEFFVSKNPLMSLGEPYWRPPMDVFDTAEGTVIRLEVAGMEIEDIDISLEQERMMIRGNRKNQQEIDATPRCYRQMEIKYADFQREVLLAMPVERDQIQATYRNGFLDIRVPLQKEAPKVKKVKIDIRKGS